MGWSTKSPVKNSIFAGYLADWPRHGDLIKRHDHQRKSGKHHQPLVMGWYGVCPKFWPNHSLNIRSLNDAFWNGHIRKAGNLLVRGISGFACTIMYYHDPPYLDLAQSIRSFRVRWSFSYLSLTECRWRPHLYCAPQSFPHSRGDGDKPRREQYPVISSAIGSKLVAPEHANQLVGIICPIAWKPLASVGVSHGIFGLQANSFSCSLVSRQLDTTGYNFSNAGKPWRKSQPLSRKMPKHAQTTME